MKHAIEILTKIRNKEVTWSSNRVICTVFNFRDLDWRRKPLPPCLVNIDFKPYKGSLNLVASWRAQYFDTKAYGNLISLAMLLKEMCEETNYRYGWISSIANKAIFKEGIGIAKELLKKMSEEP